MGMEEETERLYRLYYNLGEIVSQGREASTELVTAARLAQIEMAKCFHDDGDPVDYDWDGIWAASERLYDALRPFADVLGVDDLPLLDC